MKRIICMLLVVLLPVCSACASSDNLSGMTDAALLQLSDAILVELQSRKSADPKTEPVESGAGFSAKYEGNGWATPEEAVLVYLAGLKTGDFTKMLSAFAIETYVDNYDLHAYIERAEGYSLTSSEIKFPNTNELLKNANIQSRINRIAYHIIFQIATINYPEFDSTMPVGMKHYAGGTDGFMAFLSDGSISLPSSFEIGEFLDPSTLSDLYLHDSNQERMKEQMNIYGADELKSVVATLSINSQKSILCVDVLRYGEKWYLASLDGNIGSFLGISPSSGGIAPFPVGE